MTSLLLTREQILAAGKRTTARRPQGSAPLADRTTVTLSAFLARLGLTVEEFESFLQRTERMLEELNLLAGRSVRQFLDDGLIAIGLADPSRPTIHNDLSVVAGAHLPDGRREEVAGRLLRRVPRPIPKKAWPAIAGLLRREADNSDTSMEDEFRLRQRPALYLVAQEVLDQNPDALVNDDELWERALVNRLTEAIRQDLDGRRHECKPERLARAHPPVHVPVDPDSGEPLLEEVASDPDSPLKSECASDVMMLLRSLERHGLSPCEVELALALVLNDGRLATAARALGLAPSTARTVAQRIRAKIRDVL